MENTVHKIGLVIFSCLALVVLFSLYYHKYQPVAGKYKIGLMYVSTMAFHLRVSDKIKALVADDKRFEIIEFSCGAVDSILMNAVCETALESSADIFITVGQTFSRHMVQVSRRRQILKPIVFLGVADPVDLGLISAVDRPGQNATGVYTLKSGEVVDFIALAKLIKPSVRNLLIPYSSHEKPSEDVVNNIKKLGMNNGVTVTGLKIDVVSETLDRISAVLAEHDMLMYLELDHTSSYAVGMGKLASQYGVTMFARSPDGIADAAISYAADSLAFAQPAFNLVKRILINNELPATMPLVLMDGSCTLIINTELCAQQGLINLDIDRIMSTIKTDSQFCVVRDHVMVQ